MRACVLFLFLLLSACTTEDGKVEVTVKFNLFNAATGGMFAHCLLRLRRDDDPHKWFDAVWGLILLALMVTGHHIIK